MAQAPNCTWTVPGIWHVLDSKYGEQVWIPIPGCCCGGSRGANGAYAEMTIKVTPAITTQFVQVVPTGLLL